jgi:hypothetical protein
VLMNWLTRRMTESGETSSLSSMTPGVTSTSRFCSVTPLILPSPAAQPRSYRSALTPRASPLRPHCLARERLLLWVPGIVRSRLDHTGVQVAVTDSDLDRILVVIAHSHALSTRETYGSGLLVFHVFCDERNIPKHQRCPAVTNLDGSNAASSKESDQLRRAGSTLKRERFKLSTRSTRR